MIQLRVLGSTDLRGPDGQALLSILSQPKRLALLTYLAIEARGGFVQRQRLLEIFWPDSDVDRSRTSLRSALSYLRKSLGEGVLVTRGDAEVGVDAERLDCDVVQFVEHLEHGDPEAAWRLYRGSLLEDVRFSELAGLERWIEDERSRLHRLAIETVTGLADRDERQGDRHSALNWTREALSLEPLSERGTRRMIGLLARTGDREGAIRAYDSFVVRLAEDLDQEPSVETKALIESIRSATHVSPSEAEVAYNGAIDVPVRTPSTDAPAARAPRRNRRLLSTTTLALAGVIVTLVLWGSFRSRTSTPVRRYSVLMAEGEEMPVNQAGRRLALSPDGSRLVYTGGPQRRLRVRRSDQLNAPALSGTDGASSPFFSPDGDRVGFFANGELRLASLDGGPIVVVTDSIGSNGGAAWGADGWLYGTAVGFGGLVRVMPASRAIPQPFTKLDTEEGETDHIWPEALPDGAGVVFTVQHGAVAGSVSSIAVADLEGGNHEVLVEGIYARYATSGHLLYVTMDSALMVAPFDAAKRAFTGPARVVTEGLRVGFGGAVDLAVSATGTLVYVAGVGRDVRELVWVTRDGVSEPVDSAWHRSFQFPTLSPDGSRIAVNIGAADAVGGMGVWIKDLRTGARSRLTESGRVSGYPSWTPDSKSVTYFSSRSEPVGLWTKPADGSAHEKLQLRLARDLAESLWSPDGEWLIYRTSNVSRLVAGSSGAADILAIRPESEAGPIPLATTPSPELAPALSPDGRWLAFSSRERGQPEIFVVPFPDVDRAKWSVTPNGGQEPVWSTGTDELFYRDPGGDMISVEVQTSPTFSFGSSTVLFDARQYEFSGLHQDYSVTSDGQRFLMVRSLAQGDPGELIVVENWFQELGNEPGR